MDLLPVILFALPIAIFASSVMWTTHSTAPIAHEHREQISRVRERVLRERLEQQRQRERAAAQHTQLREQHTSQRPSAPRAADIDTHTLPPPPYEAATASSNSASDSASASASVSSSPASPRPSAPVADRASPATATLDCPICLDKLTYAIETNCAHLYCAECFLEYYDRGAPAPSLLPQPVTCPCCRRRVDALITRFSHSEEHSPDMAALLTRIQHYNSRFSGESRPLSDHLRDTPVYLRRMAGEAVSSPSSLVRLLFRSHFALSVVGSLLYVFSPFDLLPELVFGVLGYVDDALILVAASVVLAGLYRAFTVQRQAQRV